MRVDSPLTVVIAPDSFKGSLTATRAAAAIAAGWASVRPADRIDLAPQADGGEGTLDAVEAAIPDAVRRDAGTVTGPDGRPVDGVWLELPDGTAVVELAQMSGLPLMGRLDAMGATTEGLGEVIRAALDAGARRLAIGLGGSASIDGGAGALAALGLRAAGGAPLPRGGGALARISGLDTRGLATAPPEGVVLLSDVTAPLLGPTGAAAIFGPQKGASHEQVGELDAALAHFSGLLGPGAEVPGAGAAGGTGYGFIAAWGAAVVSGADYLAGLARLPERLSAADVLLTGEGRFDATSAAGKLVGQLIGLAAEHGTRVGVVAGQLAADPGTAWSGSLVDLAGSVPRALAEPERWLRVAGAAAASALG